MHKLLEIQVILRKQNFNFQSMYIFQTFHESQIIMSYKCDICESLYKHKHKLVYHLKIKHSSEMSSNSSKRPYHISDDIEKGYNNFVANLASQREAWRSAEVAEDKIDSLTIDSISKNKLIMDNDVTVNDLVSTEILEFEKANTTRAAKIIAKLKDLKESVDDDDFAYVQVRVDELATVTTIEDMKLSSIMYELLHLLTQKDLAYRLNERLILNRQVKEYIKSKNESLEI